MIFQGIVIAHTWETFFGFLKTPPVPVLSLPLPFESEVPFSKEIFMCLKLSFCRNHGLLWWKNPFENIWQFISAISNFQLLHSEWQEAL